MTTVKKTTKKTNLKAVASADVAELDVEASKPTENKPVDPNLIKKKEIYDHVSVSTGLRKRDVREAVDSLLEYLHACLEDGKTVQVPPLGKIKPIERGSGDNAKTLYKLMLKKNNVSEKNPSDVKLPLDATGDSV